MILGGGQKPVVTSAPPDIKNWKNIGATWNAVVVLLEDGTLTAWGESFKYRLIPEQLPLLEQIAVGTEHIVAVTRDQYVIAWGWNEHGNCGAPTETKFLDNRWTTIGGYKGEVDWIAAGWAPTFIVTRERDAKSVGSVLCKVKSPAKQDTDTSEEIQGEARLHTSEG